MMLMITLDFHCTAAMSVAVGKVLRLRIQKEEEAEGMRHMTQTLQILSKKIVGEEATADSTIATIIVLTQYERLLGQHQRAHIHFQGLGRILQLRGGLARLAREKPSLAQKIIRFVECLFPGDERLMRLTL